jgi:hypothetical protein
MVNPGDLWRAEQARGQEGRETPTKRQRAPEESEGAE